jgi:signal transduction histidine kinase
VTMSGRPWPGLRGERRWQLLAEASTAFESSLDHEVTLDNVVRLMVPSLADLCSVLVLDDNGAPAYGSGAAIDAESERILQQLGEFMHACSTPGHPVGHAIQSRELAVYELTPSSLRQFAVSEEHWRLLRELQPTGVIIAPLSDREHLLGVLVFGMLRQTSRRFAPQDVALARELGRRASLAIANAQMYGAAQQAIRTRDQLVATLSHDLKDPIGTVRMAIDFALDGLSGEARRAVYQTLSAGRRAADRMLRLVHDLLDVTAIEAGRLAVVRAPEDAATLVADALESQRLAAHARGLSLEKEIAPELPKVLVDRERIAQVFSNLIANAVKFTPAGGRICVRARRDGDAVQFTVADTGPGIDAADLPHVFDRFWRGRPSGRGGTGLGLAISHGIVVAHGGVLSVESRPGAGTDFSFGLPTVASDGEGALPSEIQAASARAIDAGDGGAVHPWALSSANRSAQPDALGDDGRIT